MAAPVTAAAGAPVVAAAAVTTPSQRSYRTASLSAQAYLADAFRGAQAIQAMLLIQQVMQTWGLLDLRKVQASWPAVQQALETLIRQQFPVAAQAGQAYFLQARAAAGVPGPLPELPAVPPPSPQLIRVTLQVTGPRALAKRIKATQPLPQAVKNTGVEVSGAAMRFVLNGARQAVLQAVDADGRAIGWMRVTAADPCAFCAMIASRGAVFKTEESAGFPAHGMCRCVAAPAFSQEAASAFQDNGLQRQWQEVTRGLSGRDARRAWRRYWDAEHPGVPGAATA